MIPNLQRNKWEFKHTDCDGVEFIMRFEAKTWPEALHNFVNFLRGSGFGVSADTVAINRTKHPLTQYVDSFKDYYEDSEQRRDDTSDSHSYAIALKYFKFGANE